MTIFSPTTAPRLQFAHQLRAVAVASVVASHLIGVFWGMPGAVEAATATPPVHGVPPAYFGLVAHQDAEPGPFGVALFFLVSGLVVPFSFRGRTIPDFLFARLLRLWPTYAIAICLDIAIATAASRHFGTHYAIPPGLIPANLFLVEDDFGQHSIDLVNWSLAVEARFYLLIAGLIAWRGVIGARTVLGTSLVLGLVEILYAAVRPDGPALRALCLDAVYIQFMLIGCLFHARLDGRLSRPGLVLAVFAGLLLSAIGWREGPNAPLFPVVFYSYAEALAFFALAFAVRRLLPRLSPLSWLADISYPLYLVQSILGYTLLKVLMLSTHLAYTTSLLAATTAIVLAAWALHLAVERPTMRLAHRLGRARARAAVA